MQSKYKWVGFLLIFVFLSLFTLSKLAKNERLASYAPLRVLAEGYTEFKHIFSDINQLKKTLIVGQNKYYNDKVEEQYLPAKSESVKQNIVETALLPFQSEKLYLGCAHGYPKEGGSLGVVENEIVLMDRIGRFYRKKGECVEKLDLPDLPNNLRDFVLYSRYRGFDGGSLRAHSFFYDNKTGLIFVAYQRYINRSKTRLVVSTILINKNFESRGNHWHDLWFGDLENTVDQSHASGGKLVLGNGNLFLTTGAGPEFFENGTLKSNAQSSTSSRGKVIDIDLNNNGSRIYSIGHRNPQGAVLIKNNELLVVEHGPQGGDEINNVVKNGNYGWPYETFGTDYGKYRKKFIGGARPASEYRLPIFSFVPSIGISSITYIQNFHPSWNGDLLVGSLKAQSLFHLKYIDGRVMYSEPIWVGSRIRDVIYLNSKIYLLTEDGFLVTLGISDSELISNKKNDGLQALNKIVEPCLKCHSFSQTNPTSMAPSLLNINNRKIGSDTFEKYSLSLKSKNDSWTKSNLRAFIANPNSFAPGTTMPNLGLKKEEIDEIVNFLTKE